jgi:uncharacterized protein with von Willebrand factor type A (vWA) domain
MQSRLVNFIQVLRSHDIRVSPAETLDAMNVASILGFGNRECLRDGLSMTLAKTPDEKAIFAQCFESYFSRSLSDFAGANAAEQVSEADDAAGEPQSQQPPLESAAEQNPELKALLESPLMHGLINNNRNELSLAISRAGDQVGLSQIEMFTQKGLYTRKMLDELGEEHIRRAVIELEQQDSPALAELQRYRDILRGQVRDYVEREYLLNAAGKNQQFMEEILSKTRLNNIEHYYLHKVHELVRKMAKRLASRHSRKRKVTRRGQLNMSKTIRRGIPNDGLMFNTYWKHRRKDKPKLLSICDVSGSVAAYAKFLLLFLYSLQDILPEVRSFAFSSKLGEVSHLFAEYPAEKAVELVNRQYGGATDYANALNDFADLALADINSDTTVIILGDARNNNGDPNLPVMESIFQRARQLIWLNPESRRAWGTGDSEMLRYQSTCHFTAECNNLKQLERIVDQLLRNSR